MTSGSQEPAVLLTSPGFGVDTRARVVYCQHLGNDRFAIGLEFFGPLQWAKPH